LPRFGYFPAVPKLTRKLRPHLLAVTLFASGVAVVLPSIGHAADPRVARKEKELSDVRHRLESIEKQLASDQRRLSDQEKKLQQAEEATAKTREQLQQVDVNIDAQQKKIEKTREDQVAVRATLSDRREDLAQQLRAAWTSGRQERLQLMLNVEKAQTLDRMLTWYDYLNRARVARIRSVESQLQQLVDLEQQLNAELQKMDSLKQERTSALQRLQQDRRSRESAMQALQAHIRDGQQEQTKLQASAEALTKLIESLRDALSDIPVDLDGKQTAFAQLKGRLPWPAKGELLAHFGDPKGGGSLRWSGVWIQQAAGTPVRAVARGRIAYVGYLRSYGLLMILEHDGGWFSLYGYLGTTDHTVGEWLEMGDRVGTVGDSGGQDKPGLYFEIRKGADSQDPVPWLAGNH